MSTALTGKVVFPVRKVCPFRIFSALCAAFLLSSCMGGRENEKAFQREMDLLAKDVSSGNMAALRSRLTPAHASAKTANGVPLVLLAAANGRRDVLELLLAKGADPAAKDARGTCALHVAAGNDHADILELLLKKGVPADIPGFYGRTPLMEAARCGSTKSFALLLAKGAEVDAKDDLGRTPLMYACMGGKDHTGMVKKLLSCGADREAADKEGRQAVIFAAERAHTDSAVTLLDKYADFSEDGDFPIGLAAMKGAIRGSDTRLAAYILKKKLPLNWDQHFVRRLLKRVNTSGIYRLMARHGLLDARRAPLLVAAKENNLVMIKFLLDNGASTLQRDERGYDAVSLATDRNVISFLKKEKAKEIGKIKAGRREEPVFRGKLLGN